MEIPVNVLRLWVTGSLLVALALILTECGNGGSSQTVKSADFVSSTQQECLDATNCTSEVQSTETLAPDVRQQFTYTCSQANPYLQNWDASQHRYITLSAVSFTSDSVTLVAKNYGSSPGNISVALGCATQPPTRTDVMISLGYHP